MYNDNNCIEKIIASGEGRKMDRSIYRRVQRKILMSALKKLSISFFEQKTTNNKKLRHCSVRFVSNVILNRAVIFVFFFLFH